MAKKKVLTPEKKYQSGYIDLTKTGPLTYRELRALNGGLPEESSANQALDFSPMQGFRNPNAYYTQPNDFGESVYDTEMANAAEFENYQDVRAEKQPWYAQWGAGTLKMLGTAATTVVDGTLGLLAGIGQGIANKFDDNENTGFLDGLWNNKVTNAMAEVSEAMEKELPNYMTRWEQEAPFWQRMFSGEGGANFWANDILKNAGFTIGAAASIYLTGGLAGLAGKGLKALGLASKLAKGAKLVDAAGDLTKAGKFAKWTANTFTSTIGEASIEALNTYRDNAKLMDMNLNQRYNEKRAEALANYQDALASGIDPEYAKASYQEELNQIDRDIAAYKKKSEGKLIDASNAVLGANIAVLALSNNLTLGSMIRGGYGNAKTLLQRAVKTVDGKPVTEAADIAKGMLNGSLRFEAKQMKHPTAKALGHWALTSTQEGLEEGAQNLASSTAQINVQANMNKWARENSTLGSMINPDATEEVTNWTKSLGKAFEENFGTANAGGWTEVAAGFISGALGVAHVHKNKQGKIRPTWQGGIKESFETVYGEKKATEEAITMMDKALTEGKFGERAKHAIAGMAIRSKLMEALETHNVEAFKNAETEALVNDALYARDLGLLDGYMAMFDEMSKPMDDDTLNEVKTLAVNKETGTSALEGRTEDEIKKTYQEKAAKSKARVKEALDEYDRAKEQYEGKFSEETMPYALKEITFKNTLLNNTHERIDTLNDEIQKLEDNEDITPSQKTELKEKKKAVEKLTKQAEELTKEIEDIQKDPSELQKTIEKKLDTARKIQLYKEAKNAIAKYKEANTLEDIKEVYELSPDSNKEEVLNQAIEQAEGETKTKLTQFKNYVGDMQLLESQVDKLFPATEESTEEANSLFKNILTRMANEMLSDNSAPLNRETVKQKLQRVIGDFVANQNKSISKTGGLTLTDKDDIDIKKGYADGIIDDDDFSPYINDEGEVDYMPGDRVKAMAQAAYDVKEWQNLIDKMTTLMGKVDMLDSLRKAAPKPEPKPEVKPAKPAAKKKPAAEAKPKGGGTVEGKSYTEEDVTIEDYDDDDFGSFEDDLGGEPEEETPQGNTEMLSEEESKAYEIINTKGKTGITYHVANCINKTAAKALKNDSVLANVRKVSSAVDIMSGLIKQRAAKRHIESAMKSLLKMVDEGPVTKKIMEKIEGMISSKEAPKTPDKSELPNTIEEQNIADENLELKDTETSMLGTANKNYDKDALKAKTLKPKEKAGWLIDWLAKKSIVPQLFLDTVSDSLMKANKGKVGKDRTTIHYLHHSDRPDDIMLAISREDVASVMDSTELAEFTFVKINDKEYLIIGNLGYDKKYQPTTEKMFETLINDIKEKHTTEGWFVSEKTNHFKDVTAGYLINSIEGRKGPQDLRNVSDIISDIYDSPEEVKWLVVEGDEKSPRPKKINVDEEKETAYMVRGGMPGQVYIYGKDGKGRYLPIAIETKFFNQAIHDMPEDCKIFKALRQIMHTLADPEATSKDKRAAAGRLKDYLVFSNTNQIHYNDEDKKYRPNTIVITVNGIPRTVIDFNKGTSGEENMEALEEAFKLINPRMQVSVSTLSKNPSVYFEANILQTNAASLHTFGSQLYVYPVDDEGNMVANKHKESKRVIKAVTVNRTRKEYINGKYYIYDGENYFNNKGEKIKDTELKEVEFGFKIKDEKVKAIKTKNGVYFRDGSNMFADNGHGGLTLLTKEEAAKVEKVIAREKAAKKQAEKLDDLIEESKKEEKEKGTTPPASTTEAEAAAAEVSLNDVTIEEGGEDGSFEDLTEDDNTDTTDLDAEYKDIVARHNVHTANGVLAAMKEAKTLDVLERLSKYISEVGGMKEQNDLLNEYNKLVAKIKEATKEEKPKKKNFVNSDKIDELIDAKDLEDSKNSVTFVARIVSDENSKLADDLFDKAIDKYNLDDNISAKELEAALKEHGVDTSQSLETILSTLDC